MWSTLLSSHVLGCPKSVFSRSVRLPTKNIGIRCLKLNSRISCINLFLVFIKVLFYMILQFLIFLRSIFSLVGSWAKVSSRSLHRCGYSENVSGIECLNLNLPTCCADSFFYLSKVCCNIAFKVWFFGSFRRNWRNSFSSIFRKSAQPCAWLRLVIVDAVALCCNKTPLSCCEYYMYTYIYIYMCAHGHKQMRTLSFLCILRSR